MSDDVSDQKLADRSQNQGDLEGRRALDPSGTHCAHLGPGRGCRGRRDHGDHPQRRFWVNLNLRRRAARRPVTANPKILSSAESQGRGQSITRAGGGLGAPWRRRWPSLWSEGAISGLGEKVGGRRREFFFGRTGSRTILEPVIHSVLGWKCMYIHILIVAELI